VSWGHFWGHQNLDLWFFGGIRIFWDDFAAASLSASDLLYLFVSTLEKLGMRSRIPQKIPRQTLDCYGHQSRVGRRDNHFWPSYTLAGIG
jgi:hypothetical protein